MSDKPGNRRRYNEKEVGRIIKRATDLQESEGRANLLDRGASIGDIEQIAAEVGVDPRYIRRAVLEIDRGDDRAEEKSLLAGSVPVEIERVIEGEVTDEQWEMIVQEIRRAQGQLGEIGKLGNSLEWTHKREDATHTQVTLSPRDGQTKIQINYNSEGGAYVSYLVTFLVSALMSLVLMKVLKLSPLIEWPAAIALITSLHLLVRIAWGIFSRSQKLKLTKLANRIETIIAEGGQSQIEESNSAESHLLYDEPESQEAARSERRVPTT